MNAQDFPSTRPYLIRALHEWCTDNGFTPYVAVRVDGSVQVPREYRLRVGRVAHQPAGQHRSNDGQQRQRGFMGIFVRALAPACQAACSCLFVHSNPLWSQSWIGWLAWRLACRTQGSDLRRMGTSSPGIPEPPNQHKCECEYIAFINQKQLPCIAAFEKIQGKLLWLGGRKTAVACWRPRPAIVR